MTRQSLIIAFAAGAVASILSALLAGMLYTPLTSLYGELFQDWFSRRGYREAVYYFGTLWIGLPWSAATFVLGTGIGVLIRHRRASFITSAAMGYILVPVVGSFFDGSIRMWRSPYGLVSFALMFISGALLFLGGWCGAKMQRPTIRSSELPPAGAAGSRSP